MIAGAMAAACAGGLKPEAPPEPTMRVRSHRVRRSKSVGGVAVDQRSFPRPLNDADLAAIEAAADKRVRRALKLKA